MRVSLFTAVLLVACLCGASDVVSAPPVPVYQGVVQNEPPGFLEDYRKGDSFEAIYFPAARASSSLPRSGKNQYGPKQLQDGDVATAWVEGAKGDGVGAWLEFTFDRATGDAAKVRDTGVAITSMDVMNGYRKSTKTWAANGRVRAFDMYANGKRVARLRLADDLRIQNVKTPRVALPPGKKTVIRLVITGIYRGRDFPDTAISELEFIGEGVF